MQFNQTLFPIDLMLLNILCYVITQTDYFIRAI